MGNHISDNWHLGGAVWINRHRRRRNQYRLDTIRSGLDTRDILLYLRSKAAVLASERAHHFDIGCNQVHRLGGQYVA